MSHPLDQERREFVRVRVQIPVRYKFLSKLRTGPELEEVFEGTTTNVGGGGLLLLGRIPVLDWIPDLLMSRIVLGVNLLLPQEESPIKALTRVAWVETFDEATMKCNLGLRFKEITQSDKDRIFKFVIRVQMPS
ncbi:MAG: PilZ domain-containing protein [Candidatus Brocadiae bacterium]|nr:PilZ domain-containing protein [Candidatus Brocadiia bacterium]